MMLLAVSKRMGSRPRPRRKPGDPYVIDSVTEEPIEALELRLRSADILFDQERNPILAVSSLYSKTITMVPGPQDLGYFQATDDEIEILRRAGYALPDWRELKLSELALQYPSWEVQTARNEE